MGKGVASGARSPAADNQPRAIQTSPQVLLSLPCPPPAAAELWLNELAAGWASTRTEPLITPGANGWPPRFTDASRTARCGICHPVSQVSRRMRGQEHEWNLEPVRHKLSPPGESLIDGKPPWKKKTFSGRSGMKKGDVWMMWGSAWLASGPHSNTFQQLKQVGSCVKMVQVDMEAPLQRASDSPEVSRCTDFTASQMIWGD